jgi:TolB-like protein/Flp pilus assembly protein TadD
VRFELQSLKWIANGAPSKWPDLVGVFIAKAGRIREHAGRSTRIGGMSESGAPGTATGPEPAAPQGPSASCDVFISYASQDAAVANAIVAALERQGLKCWIAPRDVVPGSLYADGIVRAISGAKVFALVLSEHAIVSSHVGKEIERASSNRRPIIALRIDLAPLTPAFQYFLSESQWIDVGAGGTEAASAKLVEAAQRHLTSRPAIEQGASPDRHTLERKSAMPPRRWIVAAVVAVVAVALAYIVVNKLWLSKQPVAAVAPAAAPGAPPISDKSIAVLPFLDMSEKKDQEYFSDGLSEELIDLLTKIPELRVPARTSSFYFKGKSEDIPTIARRLLVAHVLEGSVRKSGNRVRITVQLVRADNGYHLWSETYDRTLDDIFKVQDEIAGEVVKALKISLGANEVPRAVASKNSEAHALLLQAEYFFNRETPDDLTRAIGYFQQALRSDPDSAPAWTGLSIALTVAWQNGWLPNDRTVQQQRAQALQAAERAIAIDPKLGAAHEALAEIRYWFDWDWAGVEAEIAKGRALDPASTWIAGSLASLRGHLNDALRLWEQATERDPLNSDAYVYRAEIYYAMGQFTEALAAARKAVELAPTASRSHTALAQMLLAVGQPDAALAEAEKESDAGSRAQARARTYILVGRRADADAALAEFEKSFAADWAYEIAALHALRGESDQAFLWLDRAHQQRNAGLIGTPSINIDSDLKSLRDDPRYKAFLRKMNLPD